MKQNSGILINKANMFHLNPLINKIYKTYKIYKQNKLNNKNQKEPPLKLGKLQLNAQDIK